MCVMCVCVFFFLPKELPIGLTRGTNTLSAERGFAHNSQKDVTVSVNHQTLQIRMLSFEV